jgi:putative ABC transport system permease protein
MAHRQKGTTGIQRQINLPWSKALCMSKSSVLIRLGRSVITASGIFLGTAFLAAVLTSSAILRGQPEGLEPGQAARQIWLVTLSLLVATVGIVNAMLMAVTERYKEIGTMKCLGALDLLVVRLFLLESGMLGTLGALAGTIVGFAAMALVYLARLGTAAFTQMGPAIVFRHGAGHGGIPLWGALLLNIVLGGLLAVLAGLYPAWRAAKMPPAAALRVEI